MLLRSRRLLTFSQGNELSPASKHDFKFKDYAPWVFRHLRALFHLDPADYLISLTSHILLSELYRLPTCQTYISGSPGKSGSFFYFSRDYRFVIKTLHHAEHKYLRKILRQYFEHVKANPNTLISQFYELHRVKMRGRKVHLVVINNGAFFCTRADNSLSCTSRYSSNVRSQGIDYWKRIRRSKTQR